MSLVTLIFFMLCWIPRLILRANVRINSLQFVCVYYFCFRTIFQRAFQLFFLLCNFVAQLKKNLKETPIGFYIKNLWSCHPLPFLLMLCMKTNRFRYRFVLKDYVFSLINIWVCPKLFHLVKRIKTRGDRNHWLTKHFFQVGISIIMGKSF